MSQLTPAVTALPGYAAGALPWGTQIPESRDTPYMIKREPTPESCGGSAGYGGSNPVVVQAGFKWSKGLLALVTYMDPRLAKVGWSVKDPSGSPTGQWVKTLSNGTRANLSISEEGLPVWELVATADSVVQAGGGCARVSHPGGDPGGRMLKSLQATTRAAIAPGSKILSSRSDGAEWLDGSEACNGKAGWILVHTNVIFTSPLPASRVIAGAEAALSAQGWTGPPMATSIGWSKTVNGGTWSVLLDQGENLDGKVIPHQWELWAQADPIGQQANTC
jgi:hypothetical protein